MGHAMRSRVVLEDLAKRHEVQVVVSGRAYDYLKQRASQQLSVQKIWGYTLVYENNEVNAFKTALENLKGAVTGWPDNIRAYLDIAERFAPDVVISDFESWSYLFAQRHDLPVISVDNMQIINRCTHSPSIIGDQVGDFELTRALVKSQAARRVSLPHHHLLLSARAQGTNDPAPADPAPGAAGGPPRVWRPPAGVSDVDLQHRVARAVAQRGPRMPDLRPPPRAQAGPGRGEPALPAVQRGRLHRGPPHRRRGGRQRRVHVDG